MKWFLLWLLFFSFSIKATEVDYGVMPNISLTKKNTERWSTNLQHYSHYVAGFKLGYLQGSLIYKYAPDLNIGVGYIYQRQNPLENNFTDENRIFQQVTYSQFLREYRFSHRGRFEERWVNNRQDIDFRTRLRYQLALQFPLQGRTLDAGEWYFNSYNEIYLSLSGNKNATFSDDWIYAGFGYKTQQLGQWEFGPVSQWSVVNKNRDWRVLNLLQLSWVYLFK